MNTETWKLTDGGGMVIDAIHVTDNEEKEIFAIIPFGPNCGNKEQAIKRGKVMAAAPELLDAAKRCVDWFYLNAKDLGLPLHGVGAPAFFEETLSAIKKATE